MKPLTIVIPVREGGNPAITLQSLGRQDDQRFDIVISQDECGSANWARNRGGDLVRTEFVLFSDDDIAWKPDAIRTMMQCLERNPDASYCYGAYEMAGRTQCNRHFCADALRRQNYISTMSIIRTADFPGFDESLQRLQDWDLWLTLLDRGKVGVYCEKVIFETFVRDGITYGPGISYQEAYSIVRSRHA